MPLYFMIFIGICNKNQMKIESLYSPKIHINVHENALGDIMTLSEAAEVASVSEVYCTVYYTSAIQFFEG